jgi:hypothetical protein
VSSWEQASTTAKIIEKPKNLRGIGVEQK